jgi:hypothetical protein
MASDQPDLQTIPRNHPEQWAPPLLMALIGGGPLTDQEKTWAGWAQSDFSPWAYLKPGVSCNWQHMIGAALLWYDPQFKISSSGPFAAANIAAWWQGLLQSQLGQLKTGTIFDSLGLTEPLSEIYEPFRWGSILGVRLLAVRSPQSLGGAAPDLLGLSAQYSAALSGLLALGGVPWTDPGYQGAAGYWYDGPTFSPVSERSEAPGLQSDRGPLFCLATGWPLSVSKRETWAGQVARLVLKESPDGLGKGACFDAAAALLRGGPVDPVIGCLAGVRLSAEQHWMSWPEGLLSYKPSRHNTNTPCVFWSWSDNAQKQMAIGWPWGTGRHREDPEPGICSIQGNQIVATLPQSGATSSHEIPTSTPIYHVMADQDGVRNG